MRPDVRGQVVGRWPSVLGRLGVPESALSGKHGPCPACGGKDRFRFDNKEGRGTWICSKCGAGDGWDLLMMVRGIDFKGAADIVRGELPHAEETKVAKDRSIEEKRAELDRVWGRAVPIEAGDSVHRYLAARGITLASTALRRVPAAAYYEDGRKSGVYDAMVAKVKGADGKGHSLHRTYLLDGRKAPVGTPRKVMSPVASIAGCAVWLAAPAATLGVAEGIETALSAQQLFGVPTWAALTANGLESFQWPDIVRKLVIFADNDESFTGQRAAYALAFRAKAKGLVVEVRMPDRAGQDWNDVLRERTAGQRAAGAAETGHEAIAESVGGEL